MRVFFFICALLAFGLGLFIFAGAAGAVHEIAALVLFLISAVLLVGAVVVDAIVDVRERLAELVKIAMRPSPPSASRPALATPASAGASRASAAAPAMYYYSSTGKETDGGPLTVAEIRQLRKDGKIHDDTLVCREGDSEWRAVCLLTEFNV